MYALSILLFLFGDYFLMKLVDSLQRKTGQFSNPWQGIHAVFDQTRCNLSFSFSFSFITTFFHYFAHMLHSFCNSLNPAFFPAHTPGQGSLFPLWHTRSHVPDRAHPGTPIHSRIHGTGGSAGLPQTVCIRSNWPYTVFS